MVVDAEVLWRGQKRARAMADLIALIRRDQPNFEPPHTLIINLSSIDVLTSKELGQLVRLRKDLAPANKPLILVIPEANRDVMELFRITGLNTLFPIYDDVESALEHI